MKLIVVLLIFLNLLNAGNLVPAISPSSPTVGDKVSYSLVIPTTGQQPSINITLSDSTNVSSDIMLVTQGVTALAGGFKYNLQFVSFSTGQINLPSFNIGEMLVAPVTVTINSVIVNTANAKLQPSYGLYNAYSDLLVLLVFLMIGLYLVYWFWLRKPKYHNITRLSGQDKVALWQNSWELLIKDVYPEDVRRFYYLVSERLRVLASALWQVDLQELTTQELRQRLAKTNYKQQALWLNVLERCDLVKFAKYLPTEVEYLKLQQDLVAYLNGCKPEESDD